MQIFFQKFPNRYLFMFRWPELTHMATSCCKEGFLVESDKCINIGNTHWNTQLTYQPGAFEFIKHFGKDLLWIMGFLLFFFLLSLVYF